MQLGQNVVTRVPRVVGAALHIYAEVTTRGPNTLATVWGASGGLSTETCLGFKDLSAAPAGSDSPPPPLTYSTIITFAYNL